jgi:hypothetical protein
MNEIMECRDVDGPTVDFPILDIAGIDVFRPGVPTRSTAQRSAEH